MGMYIPRRQMMLVIGFVGIVACAAAVLISWTRTVEIDVNSGTLRESQFLFGVKIESVLKPTRFSRYVDEHQLRVDVERWESESTKRWPFRSPSPHYVLHGAHQSVDSLMMAFELSNLNDHSKEQLVKEAMSRLNCGRKFTVSITDMGEVAISE